jgi:glycosyltransferase involved in cell wall biosynthesis
MVPAGRTARAAPEERRYACGMAKQRWVVVRAGEQRRWGGEIRRQEIFARLAARTGASVADGWPAFRREILGGRLRRIADRVGIRPPPASQRPLAASEQAPASWLDWIPGHVDPAVVAIYDDHVLQARAINIELTEARVEELTTRRARNEAMFRWHVVPTASFARFIGLDMDRVIVGGNGTVTARVRPGPWPDVPTIGIASGAAPGRGLEALVEAARRIRTNLRDLRLWLWLAATGGSAEAYIEQLRASLEGSDWIHIGVAPYEQLGDALSQASVLVIPSPATEYSDVALPVKLFDYMAVGRPLVVTPRIETAAIVKRFDVGLVAPGDDPDSLAESLTVLLNDSRRAHEIGRRARAAAEKHFDWAVVGDRIADEVLRREGGA